MSTILNTNGENLAIPAILNPDDFGCAIITAEWNPDITHALRDGAVQTLIAAGAKPENIYQYDVPGTVELVYAAARAIRHHSRPLSAVIVIGTVIRGDTPHFDYVCQQAAQGVAQLNAAGEIPVIFGVLTVDTLLQAQERAGGALGNKGAEAAVAAIEMDSYTRSLR